MWRFVQTVLLDSLCVWDSDTSPFLKNHEKLFWSVKLKNHIWPGEPSCSFAFLKLYSVFFKIWCPLHSFIYYYEFVFLVFLFNVPWYSIMNVVEVVFYYLLPCLTSLWAAIYGLIFQQLPWWFSFAILWQSGRNLNSWGKVISERFCKTSRLFSLKNVWIKIVIFWPKERLINNNH